MGNKHSWQDSSKGGGDFNAHYCASELFPHSQVELGEAMLCCKIYRFQRICISKYLFCPECAVEYAEPVWVNRDPEWRNAENWSIFVRSTGARWPLAWPMVTRGTSPGHQHLATNNKQLSPTRNVWLTCIRRKSMSQESQRVFSPPFGSFEPS